jgi:hypothetical protein
MTMRKLLGASLFLTMVLFVTVSISFGATNRVTQLTNNSEADWNPQINNNGHVVWRGKDGSDYEIFLYDGSTVTQLTDNDYADGNPQINDSGYVVWIQQGKVVLYDGSITTELTDNSIIPHSPRINNHGWVVFNGADASGPYYDNANEIFLYDGTSVRQITDNDLTDVKPQINDSGYVVWSGSGDSYTYNEIFLYDGTDITQITNNVFLDWDFQINANGHVVWQGEDGSDTEIFLYDGSSITQLTDNAGYDGQPQINDNGYVVMEGWSYPGYFPDIYLYDGTSTTLLTDNLVDEDAPQLSNNGYAVWAGWDGSDYEIFLYDGSTVTQLTDNAHKDRDPKINDNGYVVWEGGGIEPDYDYEIYLATPGNTPPGQDIVVAPGDCLGGSVGGTPVTLSFEQVDVVGNTTLCTSLRGTSPPSGFERISPSTYYEIKTAATHSGNIEVCIDYGNDYPDENKLKLFHQSEGQPWQNVTSSQDTENNIICGTVTSFSVFSIFAPEDSPPVGGIAEPINKMQLLVPWMILATLLLLTIGILIFSRVRR